MPCLRLRDAEKLMAEMAITLGVPVSMPLRVDLGRCPSRLSSGAAHHCGEFLASTEKAPPRAAKLGWNALDLAGPEASADLAPKVPPSVIYSKDHSRPDQRNHHPPPDPIARYALR